MELRRYLSVVRRRALLMVAIIGAAMVAGWLITPRGTTYTASSTLYIGSRSIDVSPQAGQLSGDRVAGFDRLINTFTAMLPSEPVASAAARDSGLKTPAGTISAETKAVQIPSANLIVVSVTDPDPATARALSNAVSTAFVRQINRFEQRDTPTVHVAEVYERAGLPAVPNSSGLARNLALGAVFGLVVAGAVIALLEHLDISLKSSDDVERHLELQVLGVIPALGEHLPTPAPGRVQPLPGVKQAGVETGTRVG